MSKKSTKQPRAFLWLVTIVGLLVMSVLLALPAIAGDPRPESLSQWGKFIGRFHPVMLHLPIGMLVLVLLMEFGRLFRKGSSTLVPVLFVALTAIVAVVTGVLLYLSGGYEGELVEDHLWRGVGFAAAMVGCVVLKLWVDRAWKKHNWTYLVALLVSSGIMAVASHDGGSITHSKTYLTEEAPDGVREVLNAFRSEEEKLEPVDAEPELVALPQEDRIVYTHLIQPIFDEKCVSCHGPDKQKGKYRMDTYELSLEGGKEGEGFEPGSAEDSNIIFRIHLPLDDEERMPPEGKPQLTKDEIALLEWWIDAGASPGLKVAEADVPEGLKAAFRIK